MADEVIGNSAEQLKVERTTAKRAFSHLVNSIIRNHKEMLEEELRNNFNKLMQEAERVMEANDDVEAGLIAELEAELDTDEEAVLTEQQKADLAKTAKECEQKLKEVKGLIQDTLWGKFGKAELSTSLQTADGTCELAADTSPSNSNQEAYEFMLNHLQKLMETAKETYSRWKRWVPLDEQESFQERLKTLELLVPKLVARKANFIQARIKKDTEGLILTGNAFSYPSPAIRLKPTALPKFTGNKRDFHRWKKDWEALQKQGEPTGSSEVKKAQLLDSLEDKIRRDLRLTSYNTAEDIFQVLENRFGNRTTIAIEIVEELQRIPPVKAYQPRNIVELIQAVEKALQDLSDLGDTGAIKNPLMTKSIETKLPETLKKEWLVYVADKKNPVALEKRFDSLLSFLKEQESIYEQLEQLRDEEPSRKESRTEARHARTKSTKAGGDYQSDLPNQMHDDDNKALGLGYIVEEDMLHVMVGINFSKRKGKMRLGQDLLPEQIKTQTPDPLTRRELLSQVAGLYDPIGIVTPIKQKGAILVRRAFQEAKEGSSLVRDTWDMALSDGSLKSMHSLGKSSLSGL